jgi:hypothetical protein
MSVGVQHLAVDSVNSVTRLQALSLPRDVDVDDATGHPTWEVSTEIDSLRMLPSTVKSRITLAPHSVLPIALPVGAAGDQLEIRLNFSEVVGPVGTVLVFCCFPLSHSIIHQHDFHTSESANFN